jgi:uncharacterized protein (TIGR02284 family)
MAKGLFVSAHSRRGQCRARVTFGQVEARLRDLDHGRRARVRQRTVLCLRSVIPKRTKSLLKRRTSRRRVAMFDRDVVSALNELIGISKDREKGFALAVKISKDPLMIRVFSEGQQSCRDASIQLQDSVRLLGGQADDSGSLKAAAHRGWLSLKNAMRAQDTCALLEECEKGEDYAKSRYADAMDLDLPQRTRAVIEVQYQAIAANRDRIRDLRTRS